MQVKETTPTVEFLDRMYSLDKDLCDKWHIAAPASSLVCAQKTVNDLEYTLSFKFYVVLDGDKEVGFFGTESDFALTSFYIAPEYRSKKDDIWNMMTSYVKVPFLCGIYDKNKRAKKFLENKNGRIHFTKNDALYYIFGE